MKSVTSLFLVLALSVGIASCDGEAGDDANGVDTLGHNTPEDTVETKQAAPEMDTVGNPGDTTGLNLSVDPDSSDDTTLK